MTTREPWRRVGTVRGAGYPRTDPLGRWFALRSGLTLRAHAADASLRCLQRFAKVPATARYDLHPGGRWLAALHDALPGARGRAAAGPVRWLYLQGPDGAVCAERAVDAPPRLTNDAVCFSDDGSKLWACLHDAETGGGKLCLFESETLSLLGELRQPEPFRELMLSLDPSRPERLVLIDTAGGSCITLRVFEARGGGIAEPGEALTRELPSQVSEPLHWAGFAPGGGALVTQDRDTEMLRWSWPDGAQLPGRTYASKAAQQGPDRVHYEGLGPGHFHNGVLWVPLLRSDGGDETAGPLVGLDPETLATVRVVPPPPPAGSELVPLGGALWGARTRSGVGVFELLP